VPEALARPLGQVAYCLGRGGAIKATLPVLVADYAENLDVNHLRCGPILVFGETCANRLSRWRGGNQLEQAAGVNYQHPATVPAAHLAPR